MRFSGSCRLDPRRDVVPDSLRLEPPGPIMRIMSHAGPDSRLRFDPSALGLCEMPRAYYLKKTEVVARDLVGRWIARWVGDVWYGARIVETEAYLGEKDAAAHSWRGRRTPRVEPMYMMGGHLYVYFVYGMHHCVNIVTGAAGVPEAVLVRAAEGPPGSPPKLMSGPGKLCAALGIDRNLTGVDLLAMGEIRIFGNPGRRRMPIGVSPRIGVDYAGEARDWPLRFFDMESASVSRPQRNRKWEIRG
jgi:DNA-3-methyladenine glycosylase